jgi:hypothetical protein
MTHHNSVVSIVTAAQRDAVLQIGRALGYEGGLDVPLSATGAEPATHYGAHAWAGDPFVALITNPWPTPPGLTEGEVAAAQAAMTVSVQSPCDNPLAHFEAQLAAAGLQRVELS